MSTTVVVVVDSIEAVVVDSSGEVVVVVAGSVSGDDVASSFGVPSSAVVVVESMEASGWVVGVVSVGVVTGTVKLCRTPPPTINPLADAVTTDKIATRRARSSLIAL